MPTPLPEGAFAAVPDSQVIANGEHDFALRINEEKLQVGANGRRTFQHVFCFTQPRSASTSGNRDTKPKDSYDPKKHCPSPNDPGAHYLPEQSELIRHDNTKEFMEVGLVLAQAPEMYLNELKNGNSRNIDIEANRRARLLKRTEVQVLKAFVEITEWLPAPKHKTEFFVGALFRDGHYELKKSKMEHVFFYNEFQPTDHVNKKVRKRALRANVLLAAATNPVSDPRATAGANDPRRMLDTLTLRHSMESVDMTHITAKITMLWALFQADTSESQTQHLRAILRELEAVHPDLQYCSTTEVEGVRAFMDWDQDFTVELSQIMEQELRTVIHEMPTLRHDHVVEVHKILRERDGKDGIVHGQKLPYRGLGLFLYLCHNESFFGSSPQFRDSVLRALDLVKVVLIYTPSSPAFPQNQTNNSEMEATKVVTECLQGISNWVHCINQRIRIHEAAMAETYGHVIAGMSLDDIHQKLVTAVDLDSFAVYASQITAVQAAQLMALNDNVHKGVREMDDLVKQVLALVPDKVD